MPIIAIRQTLVILFDDIEVLSCSQESIGHATNKLDISSRLNSRKHDGIDSDKAVRKADIIILANNGSNVVDKTDDKCHQTLRDSHC